LNRFGASVAGGGARGRLTGGEGIFNRESGSHTSYRLRSEKGKWHDFDFVVVLVDSAFTKKEEKCFGLVAPRRYSSADIHGESS
jgi:hypothetical protein